MRLSRTGYVPNYVSENVQADHVYGSEGCRARPADSRSREYVHFLDCQVQLLRQPHHVEHRKRADAVGDEILRILLRFLQPAGRWCWWSRWSPASVGSPLS